MAEFSKTVIEFLEPTLGKLTARKALELVATRNGVRPEQLRESDIDKVCDGLRPMLRTLLGAATTQQLLGDLRARTGA
ncbi:MAG: hypothetical protein IPK80_23370 [Nannocystis sp.]|jgi:hypothetical protein|nr:hypothetical protein [Nannocystis sp.]